MCVTEKNAYITTDELFKKYGDPEYEKETKEHIKQATYDELKTWNFPPETIEENKKVLRTSKLGYLQKKFGMEKLHEMQYLPKIASIFVLRDDGNKIEVVSQENIEGYTTLFEDMTRNIKPLIFKNYNKGHLTVLLFFNKEPRLVPDTDKDKSMVKELNFDLSK